MSESRIRLLHGVFAVALFTSMSGAQAATVDHTFGGSITKSAGIDDNGGDDGDFAFEIDSSSQMSEGNLILWDGVTNYDGSEDADFGGSSGIVLLDPASGLGSVDEASGRSAAPFLPTTFSAGPFGVEQFTFVDDAQQYVIYQWTITNTSGASVPAKLLFATDWDLDDGSTDELTGFDGARSLVYQQDSPAAGGDADYTTGGVALLSGTFDDYRLEYCCDLTDDDTTQDNYFMGIGTGNLDTDADDDKEVGVSANLGTLAVGESACVAFVQAAAQGSSPASGVANLRAQVDAAAVLYATIPGAFACSAAPPSGGATEIPTMSQLALLLMAGLLGLLGMATLRARHSI